MHVNRWHRWINVWRLVLFVGVIGSSAEAAELPYLELPDKDAPWEIDSYFNGSRFTLTLPLSNEASRRLPDALVRELRQRESYRDGNVDAAVQAQQQFHQLLNAGPLSKQLEYQRQLNNIVISIHPRDVEQHDDPLYRHRPLLKKLPAYTQLQLFVPDLLVTETEKSLLDLGLVNRSVINSVDIWAHYESGILLRHSTSRWAQDLFEVVLDSSDKKQIVIPMSRYQIHDLKRSDNDYLNQLVDDGYGVVKTPLFFRGGNLLMGENRHGKKILFIGERELQKGRGDYYTSLFIQPEDSLVIEMMRQFSGADEVVVISNSEQLFHLDMAMSFIGKGKVALLNPIDATGAATEERKVLTELKQRLYKSGFEIFPIPTTVARMEKFQSSVNGIVYTDRDDQRIRAFVPEFIDQQVQHAGRQQSLNHLIMQAYRRSGVEPMAIEERFHSLSGNLHCAFKVID